MKLYVSGPMSGLPQHNYPLFNRVAKQLRTAGYEVLNPAELDLVEKKEHWSDCLRRDIKYLVECDAVALLPNWRESKGARLEEYIAKELEMTVKEYDHFLKEKINNGKPTE